MCKTNRYETTAILIGSLILMGLVLFFFSCSTPKKSQGQKDFEARSERQQLLQEVRRQYPCDTGKLIQGKVIYQTGPVVYIKDTITGKYRETQCPPARIRVDTLPVYDMASLQIIRDSVDNLKFLLEGAIKAHNDSEKEKSKLQDKVNELTQFKTRYIAAIVILGLIGVFSILRKIKLI